MKSLLKTMTTARLMSIVALAGVLLFVLFVALSRGWSDYLEYSANFIAAKYQNVWRLIIIDALIGIAMVVVVTLFKPWDQSPLRRLFVRPSRSAQIDWLLWILRTSFIVEILVFLVTLGLLRNVRWSLKHALGIEEEWLFLMENIWLQQLIFFFVLDFFFYWLHRLEHKLPFLWAFHKFHHSANEMNVITSKREHPIESEIFRNVFQALPFAILGAPFVSYVIFRIIRRILPALQHSDLNWSWGWFGKWVIVSPRYHEVHHSIAPEHMDKNFAGYFPILDHLFGTYYDGEVDKVEFGVTDDTLNETTVLNSLWIPFVESAEAIKSFWRKSQPQETSSSREG